MSAWIAVAGLLAFAAWQDLRIRRLKLELDEGLRWNAELVSLLTEHGVVRWDGIGVVIQPLNFDRSLEILRKQVLN